MDLEDYWEYFGQQWRATNGAKHGRSDSKLVGKCEEKKTVLPWTFREERRKLWKGHHVWNVAWPSS